MIQRYCAGRAVIIALPGGDLNGGIGLINKAIDLNPNNAAALQTAGLLHAYAGDTQSAIAQLERSVRLNPVNRTVDFYIAYVLAHFVAGEYEAVVEWTGKALQEHAQLCACAALSGGKPRSARSSGRRSAGRATTA